jgi:hypothetical protein
MCFFKYEKTIISSCAIERLVERTFGAYAKRRIEAETNTRDALKSPRLIWLLFSYKIPFLIVFYIKKQEAQ